MRAIRAAAALIAAAALAFAIPGAAHAAGESTSDFGFPASASTHFYELGFTRYANLPQGTPYIVVLNDSDVLALDWDFEVARINVNDGAATELAPLGLPAGSRVLDLVKLDEMPQSASRATVLVSYSGDDGTGVCTRLTTREASIDLQAGGASTLGRVWFQTPCMKVDVTAKPSPLAMSGGRVIAVPKAWRANPKQLELFVSVGGFGFTPAQRAALPKTQRQQLHSIVRVSSPRVSTVYATGFRNVQGMAVVTMSGKLELLATSHGPRGGDEINVVKQGVDYGWPRVSYGTTYSAGRAADTPAKAGSHAGYQLPLFSWVPSVAPTSILQVSGPTFARWWTNGGKKPEGDLMMSAMGAQHLVRVRVDGGAVRYVESAYIGARVRTLVQMPNGVMVAGIDAGADLVVVKPTSMWTVLE